MILIRNNQIWCRHVHVHLRVLVVHLYSFIFVRAGRRGGDVPSAVCSIAVQMSCGVSLLVWPHFSWRRDEHDAPMPNDDTARLSLSQRASREHETNHKKTRRLPAVRLLRRSGPPQLGFLVLGPKKTIPLGAECRILYWVGISGGGGIKNCPDSRLSYNV